MTKEPGENETADLHSQVTALEGQLERQALERAELPVPRPSRRLLALTLAVAAVVTLAIRLPALNDSRLDKNSQLGNTIAALETARRVVQTYWDSTGTPPLSLAEVGLSDLPIAYSTTLTDFRLAAASPFGDSLGYQSPRRAALGTRR